MSDSAGLTTGTRKQKLFFKCTTHDHWPVLISGDAPELGAWNLSAAVVMQSNPRPHGRFEWHAQAELPLGLTIEYKFVQKSDHGPRWESGSNHRFTVIPDLHTLERDFRE